ALCPAALPAGNPLVADEPRRAQLRQLLLDLLPQPGREPRAVADEVELPVLVVHPEQQRRDPALRLLAVVEADDHAVGRLVLLDLGHRLTGPRSIGRVEPLGNDSVQPGGFNPVEPALRLLSVARVRRELEALRLALELLAPFLERELVQL